MTKSSSLLFQRRFFPYFVTQFFGAFNDNIFKNVLLLFVAFAGAESLPVSSNLFINLAAGLFILPFFLFSASAGLLADKYEKSAFIRKVKLLEIAIMLLGAIGFVTHSYGVLLLILFLMGTQSAIFGPVKYALLPQQLKPSELVPGNALVETGTFMAILLGTIGAGIIASLDFSAEIAAGAVVIFAFLGYLASRWIPQAPASAPELRFRWRPIAHTKRTLAIAKSNRTIYRAILAISWFWFLGASYLTQFPNFTHQYLHGSETAVSFLLALFSVGIALGSLLYDRLTKHRIELGLIPLSGFAITLFGYLFATQIPEALPNYANFTRFVSASVLWPTFGYLFLLGMSGGMFIVPLYALMQQKAKVNERAQVIAALNIYNSLFMVLSAILGIVALSLIHLSIPQLFGLLAIFNLIVSIALLYQFPVHVTRLFVWLMTRTLYRVREKNLEQLPQEGGALLICNHVSYMDALLLSAASNRLIRFVMEEDYANFPVVAGFLRRAGVIPINARRGSTIRRAFGEVEQALKNGELVCIFPEGRLTPDGNIQPFMRGLDIILSRCKAPVIPIALKGLWGSYFSRYKGRACKGVPSCWLAKVAIEVGEPIAPEHANIEKLQLALTNLRGAAE
ncbi:MFS transporter [Vibrio nitrifigilis]|uniref:MFS transporter n=1 Tax=Vibrio nitrifigilis TaxID=2789781 RepID=A0ABS0GB73_9VIBR|nr:MFS transporter [Vibrio nitrifigilis]MBF8999651.1 MFS transporter [Vibrio nitrifigilis]